MSFVGGLLGGGSGYGASAKQAPVIAAATRAQADEQYKNAQDAIDKQGQFLTAVQGQNGLQNQTNVFNQQQAIANGQGPNPAQAMLANSTGQNISNQAALMAGQRGSAANAGLIARQAAQQGGNLQQQAAGQGAALQANQSLNAVNQMGNIANAQVNQLGQAQGAYTNAVTNEQSNILNAINGVNAATNASYNGYNSANASLAGTQAGGQNALLGAGAGMLGSLAESMFAGGGNVMSPGDEGSDQPDLPDESDPAARTSAAPAINYGSSTSTPPVPGATTTGPQSKVGKYMSEAGDNIQSNFAPKGSGGGAGVPLNALGSQLGDMLGDGLQSAGSWIGEGLSSIGTALGGYLEAAGPALAGAAEEIAPAAAVVAAKGGKVPALVSPGERYIPPQDIKKVAKGQNPLQVGEKIPGKPKHPGNDYRNDVVPKTLESGGIVIPNSVMQSKDPAKKAMEFVAAHMAKNGKLTKKSSK